MPSPFDYVSPGYAPAPASYQAPNMAAQLYGMISNVPNDYYQGAQLAKQHQLSNLFSGGLPTRPNGQPDIGGISQQLIKTGGADYAKELLQFLFRQQGYNALNNPNPTPWLPSPTTGGESSSSNYPQQDIGRSVEGQRPDLLRGTGPPPPNYGIGQVRNMESTPDNSPPSVGAAGGAPISPNPTAPGGGMPSNYGQLAQAPQGLSLAGAAGLVPPAWFRRPAGGYDNSMAGYADYVDNRAKQFSLLGDTESAKIEHDKAEAIRKAITQAGELTNEEKLARASNTTPLGYEQAKTAGTENAKYFSTIYKGLTGSAMIAAQQKQNIALLRQVAASPNFIPGTGSQAALWLQRAAAQIGLDPTRAAPREVFNQVATRVLADQFAGIKSMASDTGEQGGRIFKPMLDLEEKANVTHEDTLAGVKAKLDILDRSGDLMIRWGDMADDYASKHGGALDPGFNKTLRGEIANARVGNVLPQSEKGMPTAPRLETREDAVAWARQQGLKTGDPMRLPSGRVVPAP